MAADELSVRPPELTQTQSVVFSAFLELAWAEGSVEQREVEFLTSLAEELGFDLGTRTARLITGLSAPPVAAVEHLAKLDLDEMERYQVVERMVALCLVRGDLTPRRGETLARLALQLGIRADELQEMRKRTC